MDQKTRAYANLSDRSYENEANGTTINSYEKIDDTVDNYGLYASAYENQDNDTLTIAYRGTDGLKDYTSNVRIGLGQDPFQLAEAQRFYEEMKQYADANDLTLEVTGHSLGGALATLIAAKNSTDDAQVKAYAYNAPGTQKTISNWGKDYAGKDYSDHIHNYNATNDPVHKLGTQPGSVENVNVSSFYGVPDIFEPFVSVVNGALGSEFPQSPLYEGFDGFKDFNLDQHSIAGLLDEANQFDSYSDDGATSGNINNFGLDGDGYKDAVTDIL